MAAFTMTVSAAAASGKKYRRMVVSFRGRAWSNPVEAADDAPGLVRRFGIFDNVLVAGRNRSLFSQKIEVDRPFPEGLAEQDDRQPFHAAGLDECQRFKKLVHRSETARKDGNRLGAHHEMHLSDGEIVEVEA